ncbi:MAG TPA: polyamine ABC transporter substrate-binding protein [Roseiarcus sp.]|jgi:putative spermidine/putrescine transport system substrate-binding protein
MTLTKTLYEKNLYPEIADLPQTSFAQDRLELAEDQLKKGLIDRRTFIRIMALIAAAPAAGRLTSAKAATKELVLVDWGGDSRPAYAKAFCDPFKSATGIDVVQDGSGPLPSKVRAMVQSGKVTWDLLDFDASKALLLDQDGLLEPIDYAIVDKNNVYPGWAYKAGVASYVYSCVLCFDTSKFPGAKPNSWKDFWDVKSFPGQRGVRKTPEGQIEACMMAAGRSIKDVYPIDLDLAVAKVREIKSYLIAWTTGSQSQDVLRNEEVTMCNLWHSRAATLYKESNARFDWTWNQGLINVDVWAVPKNNPAGREAAMKFIAFAQDPKRQIELLKALGNGPVNPAATALVPDAVKKFDPSQPDHRAVQAELNPEWWCAPSGKGNKNNDTLAREMWLDVLSA